MSPANTQIKIASILYLFSALLFAPFVPVLTVVLLIPGAILLANSFLSLEELHKNKVSLIILAIISFILNLPAAILILVSLSEINSVKLEKSHAPPTTESKRIDLLLKLGLVMILVSGILFATTTWEIISNLVKVIALVGMGAIFLGLSKFSEVKWKIASTTKAYYILGLSFFFLTWVGVGYFGVISPWFSYTGEGSNLVYFITLILLSAFLYLINHKFDEKEYLYMGHMSIYLGAYHALAALGLDLLQTVLALSAITLIINILPNKKLLSSVKDVNYIISYLFTAIIITQVFKANKYVVLITCLLNVANVLYLGFTKKKPLNHVLSAAISYSLLTIATLKLDVFNDNAIALFTVISAFSLLMKYQKLNQSKWLVSTSQIIYHFISTILVIVISTYSEPKVLIISTIYLVLNIINSLDLYKNKEQVDFRYQPIVILIFSFSLLYFINEILVYVGDLLAISLTSFIYAVIYHLSNNKEYKKYYFIALIMALAFNCLYNLVYFEIVSVIVTLLLTIYLFFTRKKEEQGARIALYIATLVNTYIATYALTYYGVNPTITNIICLVIYVLITILVKESKFKTINYIAIVVPLYSLVYTIDMAYNLKMMITNIFWLYILFLFVKFIIKNENTKDLIATIGLSLIILSIIFEADILIGIYIGILSIAIIFITFNKENYKKLFLTGIIITLINIVVQLWEFWTQIPFYLYLLIVGVAIVGFVTYKELKKKDQPEKIQPQPLPQVENKEIPVPTEKPVERFQIVEDNQVENEQEEILPEEEPQEEVVEEVEQEEIKQPYVPKVVGFCPACGTKNNGGKFCRNCGRNLQR